MSVLRMSEEQFQAHQKRAKRPVTRVEVPPPSSTHLKYKNRPTGGYASVKEARRAQALRLMQQAGEIRNLREQVEFVVIPKQMQAGKVAERECKYIADFVYDEHRTDLGFVHWMPVVEDVKSPSSRTKDYIIKRKLMLKVHGIRIRET